MKTPTKNNRNTYDSLAVSQYMESNSAARLSRSSNPFSKSQYTDEDNRFYTSSHKEIITTPSKRSYHREEGSVYSASSYKRSKINSLTPYGLQNKALHSGHDVNMWMEKSELLTKMTENQYKANKALQNISALLREVDRSTAQLKHMGLLR
uniref:Uncharacterized protein n=1 Tax=Babesia bovis TaxID=5865 RepID=S6BF99_BABBO|nr:hypothetical protein [Babesia bovis]